VHVLLEELKISLKSSFSTQSLRHTVSHRVGVRVPSMTLHSCSLLISSPLTPAAACLCFSPYFQRWQLIFVHPLLLTIISVATGRRLSLIELCPSFSMDCVRSSTVRCKSRDSDVHTAYNAILLSYIRRINCNVPNQ